MTTLELQLSIQEMVKEEKDVNWLRFLHDMLDFRLHSWRTNGTANGKAVSSPQLTEMFEDGEDDVPWGESFEKDMSPEDEARLFAAIEAANNPDNIIPEAEVYKHLKRLPKNMIR